MVAVPKEATGFYQIANLHDKTKDVFLCYKAPYDFTKSLPDGNWELLGEADKEGVKFVCDPYVYGEGGEDIVIGRFRGRSVNRCYADYTLGEPNSYTTELVSPEASFITLLESNGIYLKNPIGANEPKMPTDEEDDDLGLVSALRDHKRGMWRHYEELTLKENEKLVVLLRKDSSSGS